MDKLKFLIILFIFFLGNLYAEIKFLDFSFKVPKEEIFTHKFEFKEDIIEATPLCGCTEANVYKDKKTSNSIVEIKFNPQGYKESKEVKQEVILKDKDNNIIRLILTFQIE
jgi:hypothetical protein